MLIILVVGALVFFVGQSQTTQLSIERDRITVDALAQAKQALIGRSAADTNRPGSLPCPDLVTNITTGTSPNIPGDGVADMLSGNDCPSYVGWLPWKTLGLPDLRDANGERLWYALSKSLRDDNSAEPINSDTIDATMPLTLDGNTAIAAIVFAPGSPLAGQNRPSNIIGDYLDGANAHGGTSSAYVSGPRGAAFNDVALGVTRVELFRIVERRVATEALDCLKAYAGDPSNHARFPWAAPLDTSAPPAYADAANTRFGRIPEPPFAATWNTNTNAGAVAATMTNTWPLSGHCPIAPGTWWSKNQWQERVFLALADAYKPVAAPMPAPSCGTCLVVNPPASIADKRVVVLVAGRALSGQQRTSNADKGNIANYLEGENANGDDIFSSLPLTATANDTVASW